MKKNISDNYNNEYVKSVDKDGLPDSVDDKPAILIPGQGKIWFKNGLMHRLNDKPAVEWDDGSLEFWVDGKRVKRLEKNEAIFYYWK